VVEHYERETSSDLQAVLGFGRQFRDTIDLEGDDRQDRTRVSLHYETAVEGVVDLASLMLFHQQTGTRQDTLDRRADDAGDPVQLIERRFEFDEETRGLEGKLSRGFDTGSASHVLVAGFEWEREELSELRDGRSTDLLTGETTRVLPPGETLPTRDLPRSQVDEVGLYLQDEIEWGSITLIPALRWDHFDLDVSLDDRIDDPARITELDSSELTASLGAVGRLGASASWYAHYAEGFRAPPAADVNLFLDYRGFVTVRSLPNPDLVPEESRNLEAGLRFEGNGLFAEVGIYRSTFDDFIESRVMVGVDPNDGALLFQSRNIDEATIHGVEARVRQQLGSLAASLADWTLEAAYHRARGERDDTGAPLNSVAPAKTVLGVHWRETGPVSASLMLSRFDKQSRTDFSEGEFFVPPAATVIDLIGRWELDSRVSIHAGLYNLADERYWRYGDVRGLDAEDPRVESLARPGRNLSVTIHLTAL
jgi:hemoglobin/transferrin/lactoferrin receptor protein